MTQVNFYTLTSTDPDARLVFVCRLTEKARELGHQVFIQTASLTEAKQLDDLLWQFRPASFIPHAVLTTADSGNPMTNAPVQLSAESAPTGFSDVLINLTDRICNLQQPYTRINEILAPDSASMQAGRERYRAYRDAGATLENFKI